MRFSSYKKKLQSTEIAFRANDEWKNKMREEILAEVRSSAVWKRADVGSPGLSFGGIFSTVLAAHLLKPVLAVFLIFSIVSYASISTVQAARASLPGDTLYSVKLGLEKAQVGLAFSETKKTELEISFATTRLQEVSEILENEENVTANIEIAMKRFNEDVGSVQKRLEKLKIEEKSEEKSVDVEEIKDE